MSEFDINPFAEPSNINPFNVSERFNCLLLDEVLSGGCCSELFRYKAASTQGNATVAGRVTGGGTYFPASGKPLANPAGLTVA